MEQVRHDHSAAAAAVAKDLVCGMTVNPATSKHRAEHAGDPDGVDAPLTEDNDDDEWHRVFDINVVGMVRVSRAALPHLRKSPAAAIVNTCSIAATAGLPARVLYGASKGAVLSMTMAMAADHLREGIRVNAVNPGLIETEIHAASGIPDRLEKLKAGVPLGRPGAAEALREAIGAPIPPFYRAEYEREVAIARRALPAASSRQFVCA